jgi:hypothetical protein
MRAAAFREFMAAASSNFTVRIIGVLLRQAVRRRLPASGSRGIDLPQTAAADD